MLTWLSPGHGVTQSHNKDHSINRSFRNSFAGPHTGNPFSFFKIVMGLVLTRVRSLFPLGNSQFRQKNSPLNFRPIVAEPIEFRGSSRTAAGQNRRKCRKFPVISLPNREWPRLGLIDWHFGTMARFLSQKDAGHRELLGCFSGSERDHRPRKAQICTLSSTYVRNLPAKARKLGALLVQGSALGMSRKCSPAELRAPPRGKVGFYNRPVPQRKGAGKGPSGQYSGRNSRPGGHFARRGGNSQAMLVL